ncbi:hypothetical protein AURDEDRAFT_123977 [Auricularia subglabra TFB-10046 SS5]|nr:hypothetical protein AURDEDRAFT_123977 [Auricularia subglabra TFB-10046 SS5]
MLTSTVAQDTTARLPARIASADDGAQSITPGPPVQETLSWTPEVILARPHVDSSHGLDALVVAATAAVGASAGEKSTTNGGDSWDRVMQVLLQSGMLQPAGTPMDHADMLVRKTATFTLNSGSQTRLLGEVELWLQGLVVADPSLFEHTEYTIKALAAQIVRDSTSALLSGSIHNMKGRHEGKPILRCWVDAHGPKAVPNPS